MNAENRELLRSKLLSETARTSWPELERLFAAGLVVRADASLDLIDVAEAFANDDQTQVAQWMKLDLLAPLDDGRARAWASPPAPELWAVVVKPWVLVQAR